jgi:ribosome-binding factor A
MKSKYAKQRPFDRAERVGGEIFAIIAELCQRRLTDPRVVGVQITSVKITKDLRLARIYYFCAGDADARHACQAGLERASGLLKREINDQLAMKFMPELVFHFDETIEEGERIDQLLRQIDAERVGE